MAQTAISWGRRRWFVVPLRRDLSLLQTRTFIDARIQWVRDRGLDHAVEKEKHLLPFHSLKDFIILSSHSLSSASAVPLAAIAERRQELSLPFRAIRFVRLFPYAFIEETPNPPSSSPPRPVIRPTTDLLRIHSDERLAFESSRANAADRLLRLLMLTPHRRLPLSLIDRLRWDLGLPCDFVRSLLPDFPDYFQISPSSAGDNLDIELVCYRKDLAVSFMEDSAMRTGDYKKGASLAFPLHFSRRFELDKKVRKWLHEWQKLPYISPYESGSNLQPKSDLAEKWIVGVLHEVLSLLIGKKTEKMNLILFAKHLGLPPGLGKLISHHPGIFYVSNKISTQTVLLREAYRRDLLLEKHPLMGIRYQYIHLMHKERNGVKKKNDQKPKRVSHSVDSYDEVEEDCQAEDEEEMVEEDVEVELTDVSDAETGDEESDDDDKIIDSNASRGTRSVKTSRFSRVRASSVEKHLLTSKTNRSGTRRISRHNSSRCNQRLPPSNRVLT
ncbi:hypothetical protein AXF42_Ash010450 [Apostasia shenzhenica]|uniref:PORR domain-containing protein n=1 Tax=Apostasia shenzhenica TaxID=1088818 RepID=A0A2I0BE22_9ASPA|nr:hypothetical protein AXF42_Ash010450 [Apostasia shenzhenica]